MSTELTIKGRLRKQDEMGKNSCRRLRSQGEIPANLMQKTNALSIAIEAKQLSLAWRNGKTFQLDFEGSVKTVTIKELQIDAVKRNALHVDLMYS